MLHFLLLLVLTASTSLHRVRPQDAMAKHIKRRRKRKRDTTDTTEAADTTEAQADAQADAQAEGPAASDWVASDLLAPLHVLHTKAKLRWVAPLGGPARGHADTLLQLAVAKANNLVEVGWWSLLQ